MKILVIVGSTKIGNTTQVVQYFEKKLKDTIKCDVEYLYLSDYRIDFCIGCHKCIFDDEKKCPHYAEVKKIEDKIIDTDALVLASPGYMFSVTGIMKNFLDHVAYNCHRPKYFHKKAYIIANCLKFQEKSLLKPMKTWMVGSGFTLCGTLSVGMFPFPLKDKILDKKRKFIDKEARKFGMKLKNNDQLKPKFGDIIIFHVFRTLCNITSSIFRADKKYFTKMNAYDKNSRWYVPAKVSFIKHHFANIIEKKVSKEIYKMIDEEKLEKVSKRYITRL